MSLPFCPSAGAARPFPPSADGEIPQPGYGVLHSQLDCTVERLLWNGLPPRYGVALPRLVCIGERLPWNERRWCLLFKCRLAYAIMDTIRFLQSLQIKSQALKRT